MGAQDFRSIGKGRSAKEAFGAARDQASWQYGHGGYTGSIAEKDGFVEYQMPEGLTVDEFAQLVQEIPSSPLEERTVFSSEWAARRYGEKALLREKYEALSARDRDIISRAAEVYGDKWGPAVAVQPEPGVFVFMGLASS
jgi:hypothetical protein